MRKSKVLLILGLAIAFSMFAFQSTVFASNSHWLGIVAQRVDGSTYQVKKSDGSNEMLDIFKIAEYASKTATNADKYKDIYCIKGGQGFAGEDSPIGNRYYDLMYDMKDYANIPDNFKYNATNNTNSILPSDEDKIVYDKNNNAVLDEQGNQKKYTNYNAVLWILDNMYLPNHSNATERQEMRDALLTAAFKEELEDEELIPRFEISQINLTDADIEVVQQLAIWHFTNPGQKYDMGKLLPAIQCNGNGFDMASRRQEDAQTLYTYLIENAQLNASQYGKGDTRYLKAPIQVLSTKATLQSYGDSTIVGPFKIEKQSDLQYTLKTKILDQNQNEIQNYTLYKEVGSTLVAVGNNKALDTVLDQNFYIGVPASTGITEISVETEVSYYESSAEFWTVSNNNGQTSGNSNIDQPVVMVTKKPQVVKKTVGNNKFDLALRKFITKINDEAPEISREPQVVVDANRQITYVHPKNPLLVETGDLVTYTLRIYNEGEVSGYASEITDDIPEGLKFVPNNATNTAYNWKMIDANGNVTTSPNEAVKITTDYLKYDDNATHLLSAFTTTMQLPDYDEVKVVFEVVEPNSSDRILVNTAEISDDRDEDNKEIKDTDSEPGDGVEGQDDIDKEYVKLKELDFALRKFITKVVPKDEIENEDSIPERTDRVPVVNLSQWAQDKVVVYEHPKTPVPVHTGDIVIYTIRVYNEGQVDGYVQTIRDDIPQGTEFILDHPINTAYHWRIVGNDERTIETNYLSKDRDRDNLLNKFDGQSMTTSNYKDVKVALRVTEENTSRKILVNTAQITNHADKYGNDYKTDNVQDIDSIPDNNNETKSTVVDTKNINKNDEYNYFAEDDIDKEYLKLESFDLALRKFITEVKSGQEVTTVTNRVPEATLNDEGMIVYKHTKEPVAVQNGDIVTYTIRLYNEGTEDGYVQTVFDNVPSGLKFLPNHETNRLYGWTQQTDGSITTDYLSIEKGVDNILRAFDGTIEHLDYKDVKVAFEVVEPNNSKRILVNTAEIADDADKDGKAVEDIDSIPGNKNETQSTNVDTSEVNKNSDYHYFKEDDIDKEYLKLKEFDLALRKFITAVNETEVNTRIPTPEINNAGRIIYKHTKDPVLVQNGDIVTYTIRVYNEGQIDGYAQSIVDDVPQGLEFIADNETNRLYGWTQQADGTITTDYLSKEKAVGNVIEAYKGTVSSLKYKDVKVAFKVVEQNSSEKIIINTAEIAEDADKNGNPVDDIDSIPGNQNEEGKDENHNFKEDDIDKEYIKLKYFDLALRKFITAVNGTEIDTRIPNPEVSENGKITYFHTKEPVLVPNASRITYTIRVYNEGTIDGYAELIRDDIPEYMEFIEDNETNKLFGWKKQEDGTITTDYLSKAKAEDNLLKAFNGKEVTTANYKDLKVVFKLINTRLPEDKILVNTAQIAEDADENGNPVDDIDSVPDNNNQEPSTTVDTSEVNKNSEYHYFKEDDIDKEYVKVQYFDLALLKWVNKVIVTEDGQTTERDTGHTGLENPEPVVKQEINRKKLDKTTVKFEYTIKITNEGQIAGYAKEISDYIPEGLEFVQADNPNWTVADGKVTTRALEGTLLQPGESAEVKIILTWIRNADNMGVKVNVAEISEDYNEYGAPDIDSTPNNKVEGEDDIDDAPVALSITTGLEVVFDIGLAGIALGALAGGAFLIRKYII